MTNDKALEAAERELETQFNQHVDDLAKARGESDADKQSIADFEARVKEIEEDKRKLTDLVERAQIILPTYYLNWHAEASTALKGGSNG